MILEKQQLMEAGMLFSQQYSVGSSTEPSMVYPITINGQQYVLVFSNNRSPVISPAKTGVYNRENIGITWSILNNISQLKKIVPISNSNILVLFHSGDSRLVKTNMNALYNAVGFGLSLSVQESYASGLSVTVSKKTTGTFGNVSYTTETQTYNTFSILDIDGTTDGTIVCATGNNGLIYSTDNGSTWKKAANNISNLNITNVFIWTGTVSGSTTKRYIARTSNGKICLTSDLAANNDNSWRIWSVLSGAYIYSICKIDDLVFICTNKGLYYVDPVNYGADAFYDKACYSIVKNNNGKYIISTANGIMYSDNLSDWVAGDKITNSYSTLFKVYNSTNKERIVVVNGSYSYYSEDKYIPVPFDASKPLTGAQAKQLVAECKAYVQSLKS